MERLPACSWAWMAEVAPGLVGESLACLWAAGLDVFLAGGWAEELRGLSAARPHGDIDLIFLAPDFAALDAFLAANPDWDEIAAKRFSHKRAALWRGVMVEWVRVWDGRTVFFGGRCALDWPAGTFEEPLAVETGRVWVISAAGLRAYRAFHPQVAAAYAQEWVTALPTPGFVLRG